MQVKALKTFEGRHGLIRAGQTVNLEDGYARDLAKNKLVELPKEGDGGGKDVIRRPAIGLRPGSNEKRPGKEARLGDGPTLTPLSLQAGRARPKPTPPPSAGGAKKAPARKKQAPKAPDAGGE